MRTPIDLKLSDTPTNDYLAPGISRVPRHSAFAAAQYGFDKSARGRPPSPSFAFISARYRKIPMIPPRDTDDSDDHRPQVRNLKAVRDRVYLSK
jgi:hypothetical protein